MTTVSNEFRSRSLGLGRWSPADPTPKTGWRCVSMRDLGGHRRDWPRCEMCDSQKVRFAHFAEHDDHEPLLVGCVCIDHMTGDLGEGAKREKAFRRAMRDQIDSQIKALEAQLAAIDAALTPSLKPSPKGWTGTIGAHRLTIFKQRDGRWGFYLDGKPHFNQGAGCFQARDAASGAYAEQSGLADRARDLFAKIEVLTAERKRWR